MNQCPLTAQGKIFTGTYYDLDLYSCLIPFPLWHILPLLFSTCFCLLESGYLTS